MKKFRKLILIFLSVLFVACVFSGCGEEAGFKWGFEHKEKLFPIRHSSPYYVPHCAVSGESKVFDKGNVTCDLHYGPIDRNENSNQSSPKEFYIVVGYVAKKVNSYIESEYKIIKTVVDDIGSDEYRVEIEKKGRKTLYHFNHSEPITIPSEAFEFGESFDIMIVAFDFDNEDLAITDGKLPLQDGRLPLEIEGYNSCTISFEVDGDKIIFTNYSPVDYK